jgi:hypothetical protein
MIAIAPRRRETMDLETTLRRLAEFPVVWLADAGSAEQRARWSREALRKKGVVLRGHESALDELVALSVEKLRSQLQVFDELVQSALRARLPGRPNERSALRDFLIFTVVVLHQSTGANIREARKRAARFFGLTCDTRFSRRQRPSLDQVKRAEERTMRRFQLLRRWGESNSLLGLTWQKGVTVLGFCLAEGAGRPLDSEAFRADATALISICRTLDAVERVARLERTRLLQAQSPVIPRNAS